MKGLKTYINEWKLTDDSMVKIERIKPKSYKELREIVIERYEQNYKILDLRDIDISNLNSLGWEYNVNGYNSKYNGFGLFYNLELVEKIDVTGWNTKQVTNMRCLFDSCEKLNEIRGIENWDVSNVDEARWMFNTCEKLKTIDLSKWKMKAQNMWRMFSYCEQLEYLDLSKFNLPFDANIHEMFISCQNLKEIKGIENWNITSNTQIRHMFNNCYSLKKLPSWYK